MGSLEKCGKVGPVAPAPLFMYMNKDCTHMYHMEMNKNSLRMKAPSTRKSAILNFVTNFGPFWAWSTCCV